MKKCASCSKDLPEAALHCVFCGAKQAPAPAVQPGLAKTAFGYSPNEMLDQLRGNQPAPYQPPPAPYQPLPPTTRGAPPQMQPPPYPSAPAPPGQPYYPPQAPNALAPMSDAHAATMFVPGGGGPQPLRQPPQAYHAGAMAPAPVTGRMGIHAENQITPAPLPAVGAVPPYLATQHAARAGRPIEPWKDSLRLMMFVWGAIALAAFATPVSTDPLTFNWDAILHGDSTMKLLALIVPAVGLLAIVIAAIPMMPLPRGVLAAVIGLAGMLVPIFMIGELPPWQLLIRIVALIVLVPGLLVRNEYTDSLFARLLVTIGVVCWLAPLLIPVSGEIPLVALFKGLIDLQGSAKIGPALELGLVVIVVMSLLAWMPGPATAGAKAFAWLVILYPTLVVQLAGVIVKGNLADAVTARPFSTVMAWAPQAAVAVLIGYGLATVFGKQLE